MKTRRNLLSTSILAILLILSGSAFAQQGRMGQRMQGNQAKFDGMQGQGRFNMMQGQGGFEARLDLNDEQKEKIQTLRIDHRKEMTHNQNLLNEKNAHLKTLLGTSDKDMKAINSTIDEISSMKGDLMKNQIANREEMKNILTPEQLELTGTFGPGMQQGAGRMNGFKQGQRGMNGQNFKQGRRSAGRGQDFMQGSRGRMNPGGARGFQGWGPELPKDN